ncbi:MAG: hypothetical protein ACI4IT_05690 [Oscillospiraceae bacterium]
MKIAKTVETMRTIVRAYDDFEARKERIKSKTQKVKNKTQNILKGGNTMKFGTILGIVVGALTLIGAGAAAMYFYLKGGCDCCCDDYDDELFDEFPEEEFATDAPVEEAPAEESEETQF